VERTIWFDLELKPLLNVHFVNPCFILQRDAVFVRVQQEATRVSSLDVFNHLHNLSLRFHTFRKTGGVLRSVERGTSGISFLLQFLLFNILPTLVELILVLIIMLSSYVGWFALITFAVIASYVAFTILVTEWRNKFRKEQNDLSALDPLNFCLLISPLTILFIRLHGQQYRCRFFAQF
jgi:ABC-type bacteriocin/lantibiotic exporter with double-glycine peptidase domain